jgi:predicted nucleic acid-binding protein
VKAFFDTSVLVGAFCGDHPRYAACFRLVGAASKKTHFCAVHAVPELYAVMTRLPVRPRITPEQGLLFVENVRDYFSVVYPLGRRAVRGGGGSGPARPGRRQGLRPAHS